MTNEIIKTERRIATLDRRALVADRRAQEAKRKAKVAQKNFERVFWITGLVIVIFMMYCMTGGLK